MEVQENEYQISQELCYTTLSARDFSETGNRARKVSGTSTTWNLITVQSKQRMLIVNKHGAIFTKRTLGKVRRCPLNSDFTVLPINPLLL